MANPEPSAGVEVRDDRTVLDILIDGQPFAVYNYASNHGGLWRPYFHPVFAGNGVVISQNGEFPGTLRGHYWHQGMFIAHQRFTGGNTWEERDGETSRILHRGFEPFTGGRTARIAETLDWLRTDGGVALHERRTITVPHRPPESRVIDVEIALRPDREAVTFEATPYHLLAFRVANSMVPLKQKSEYVARYGRRVEYGPLDRGGTITNSEGQKDEGATGGHARWIDLSGPLGGETWGVAILSHPENFRRPEAFNNWNNQTITAAPTYHEPHTLRAGEELRLRYRVLIHRGDVRAGRVAEEFAEYASGRQA